MLEPSDSGLPLGLTPEFSKSLSDILEEDGSTDSMVCLVFTGETTVCRILLSFSKTDD